MTQTNRPVFSPDSRRTTVRQVDVFRAVDA